MKDVEPKFRCAVCNRGVLNRSVVHCLYCGAHLPAEARLAPELIAQRDAELARREAARARLAAPQQPDASPLNPLDVIQVVDVSADLVEMLGEGISAIGDLLG
jgi:hypothetical protein